MTTVTAFIKRHPVLAFYALVFAISWGGVLLVIGALGGVPDTREGYARLLPIAISVMLAGPPAAGILLTGLVDGRAGFREVLSRLLRWRVGAGWYAVALLAAPLFLMAIPLALSLTSPVFLPGIFATEDRASRLLFAITVGLVGGFLEELGWTGFATPRLRLRHGVLTTGLIVGVLWGAWHIIGNAVFASGTYAGALSLPLFLTARSVSLLAGGLPALRVLMVWVYDRTGSLLVAVLMHVSLTAGTLIVEPVAISGTALLTLDLVSAVAWWIIVAAVARSKGGQLSRQPLRTQAA